MARDSGLQDILNLEEELGLHGTNDEMGQDAGPSEFFLQAESGEPCGFLA